MTLPILELPVMQYEGECPERKVVPIIKEMTLEIWLNDRLLVEIACAGMHLEELALGYLKSENVIVAMENISGIEIDDTIPRVRVITKGKETSERGARKIMSSGARGKAGTLPAKPVDSSLSIKAQRVLGLMEELLAATAIHEITKGTHCSAIADGERILCLREDIGRHNTIDMLTGYALKNGMDGGSYAVLTTGRISREITEKAWIQGIPVIISHSAPTSGAVELALTAGITLIGYVRNGRMNVYTNYTRVEF